jgi:predicted nucleic acid-binding protein
LEACQRRNLLSGQRASGGRLKRTNDERQSEFLLSCVSPRVAHQLSSLASEEVISFEQTTTQLAGRIARELERLGRPIRIADSMIAAIALEHSPELVTGKTAHWRI